MLGSRRTPATDKDKLSVSPHIPNSSAECGADEGVEGEALDEIGIDHQGDAEQEADHVAFAFAATEGGQSHGAEDDDDEKCRGIGHIVAAGTLEDCEGAPLTRTSNMDMIMSI